MTVLNLRNVFLSKGITSPHAWLVKHGIDSDTATRLLNPKRKHVSLKHIDIICYELRLTPNDIMLWQPNNKNQDIADHPLQDMRTGQPNPDLNYLTKKASMAVIKKTEAFMKQENAKEEEERKKRMEERKKKV
jgi:DNA-binding Xre family transcriptional regulator